MESNDLAGFTPETRADETAKQMVNPNTRLQSKISEQFRIIPKPPQNEDVATFYRRILEG